MRFPLIRPVMPESSAVLSSINESLTSGQITKGPRLGQFEAAVADVLGVESVVAVSSATVGLALVMRLLTSGVGKIAMPSFTFMATGTAALWAGTTLVFTDVSPVDGNVSIADMQEVAQGSKVIVGVHNFGNPARINEMNALGASLGAAVLFDAAHAFGSKYDGKYVGSDDGVSVFSLSPTKILIAGEGGIIASRDQDLLSELRVLREYGNAGNYSVDGVPGLNGRMSEFHAAMGIVGLRTLESHIEVRNEIAQYYRSRFEQIPSIWLPTVRSEDRSTYKDFTLFVEESEQSSRDGLRSWLAEFEIETKAYWSPPLHAQPGFNSDRSLPVTERLSRECLSIPIWSDMSIEDAKTIADAIEEYFWRSRH